MNVGDYVRFKDKRGNTYIRKIIDLPQDIRYGAIEIDIETNYSNMLSPKNVIKSSPNIIDLIEVGDLVYVDISPDDCGGIIVPRITETKNELNSLKLLIENKDYILKSIIIHEQIENIEYKVKE